MSQDDIDLVRVLASSSVDLLPFFFTLLWKRSNGSGGSHELTDVVIPDTVVLHRSRPIHWFFTSKEGTIRMKARRNLTTEVLLDHLSSKKRVSVSGCATHFVRHEETANDGVITSHQHVDELPSFVSSNPHAGLLQQYVDPKGESGLHRNFEIVSNWTPNVVYMERRLNDSKLVATPHEQHALESRRNQAAMATGGGLAFDEAAAKRAAQQELDDRCTAAETGRYVKTAAVVSHRTLRAVERVSTAIAEHIGTVFGVQVTNLTLHTKIDKLDRVVVLRCSTLRCVSAKSGREAGGMSLELRSISAAPAGSVGGGRRGRRDDAGDDDDDDDGAGTAASGGPSLMSASGVADSVGTRASNRRRRVCCLCAAGEITAGDAEGRAPLGMCRVARQHILFPLSVMEFYSRHANTGAPADDTADEKDGSKPPPFKKPAKDIVFKGAEEAAAWAPADGVPAHVKLVSPELRPADYDALRHDGKWLREKVAVCQGCADSMFAITTAIHVDDGGQIRLPRKGAAGTFKPLDARGEKNVAPATGNPASEDAAPPSAPPAPTASDRADNPASPAVAKAKASPYKARTPAPRTRQPATTPTAKATTPQKKRGGVTSTTPALPPIAKTPTHRRSTKL